MTRNGKRFLKLLSAGLIVLASLLPEMGGLTHPALRSAGLLLASLLLWITEAMPMSLSILLMTAVAMLLGLSSPADALARLDEGTALFVLASSGITAAIALSGIPRRITSWLLRFSANERDGSVHAGRFVMGLGLLVALCSSFMSSLATCALFAGLVNGMLGPKKTSLRRCMMLVIPACAGIGGFMTPAGTPANLLLLRLLEKTGTPVTFLQWSLIGIPAGLLTATLFTGSALLMLRPTAKELTGSVGNETGSSPRRDALTAGIILLILSGWITSGWLPWLKLWHVACAGVAVMLLPGVRLLTLNALKSHINWDLAVTMATVGALMGAVSDSGLMAWIAQQLITPLSALPGWLLLPGLSLTVCCIRAFIPTTTGAVTLLAPLLTGLATAAGLPAHVLLMLLAFWTASAMLVVYTEPIYLLTWERKDYSALDLLRTGALPSLLMAMPGSFLLQALTLAVLGL